MGDTSPKVTSVTEKTLPDDSSQGAATTSSVGRFQRLEEIFHRALELEGSERKNYLKEACGADEELMREVQQMLGFDETQQGGIDEVVNVGLEAWSRRQVPERIGPYRVLNLLGRGGLGEVYLAERDDEHFKKRVAVKWIRPELGNADLERRFRFERQVLANLDHPNIARILDGGTADGSPYIVMELVEGKRLLSYCRDHKLSVPEVLEIFRKICDSVHYAHQNLILHCDLKPSNILVEEGGHPKLLDFGIAKALQDDSPDGLIGLTQTSPGARPLTPEYASPEQVQYLPLTTSSDIYSLGVVLYELLCGERPYRIETRNPLRIAEVIVEEDPPTPSSRYRKAESENRDRSVPWSPDLDAIVAKALRKNPERRYRSVEQFSEDIQRYLDHRPVLARQGSLVYHWSKLIRRHRMLAGALVAVILALSTTIVVTRQQAQVARSERVRAEENLARAEEEKERAEAVVDLLVGLFEEPDPQVSLGSEVTAREILDRGSRSIRRRLIDHPKVWAALAGTMGRVYQELNIYDQAENHLSDSLDARLRLFGEEAPEVVESRHQLAKLFIIQDRFEEADDLLDLALASEAEARGTSTPTYGMLLRLRGNSHLNQGETQKAREFLEQALGEGRAEASDDPGEAWDLLGQVAHSEGEYARAEEFCLRGLELRQKFFGNEHPKVAFSLNNLAAIRHISGDLEGARKVLEETLAMRRQLYGDHHGAVARSLQNLAANRVRAGDSARAEELMNEAFAIVQELYGPDHTAVADVLYTRARWESRQRRHAEAVKLYEKVLEIRRAKLGPRHLDTANTLLVLANSLRDLDSERAKKTYREVDSIYQEILTPDDSRTAEPLERLGTLVCRESPQEGVTLLEITLEIRRQSREAKHWKTAMGEAYLGRCLIALDPPRALDHLHRAKDELEASLGAESAWTQRVLEWLQEADAALNGTRDGG